MTKGIEPMSRFVITVSTAYGNTFHTVYPPVILGVIVGCFDLQYMGKDFKEIFV